LLTSGGYVSWADGGREGRMEKTQRFADDMVDSRKEVTWRLKGGCSLEDETKGISHGVMKVGLWAARHENEWSPNGSVVAGQVLVPCLLSHGVSAEQS
jgi:hypothetical protein